MTRILSRALSALVALSLALAPVVAMAQTAVDPVARGLATQALAAAKSGSVNELQLPLTTSPSSGVITQGGSVVFSTYGYNPSNAPLGNIFLGQGSGNFTLAQSGGVNPNANICIGRFTCEALTFGNRNVAIGESALSAVTGGDGTVAIGDLAGSSMTTGYRNIYAGFGTGRLLASSDFENTLTGAYSGYWAVSGQQNSCYGAWTCGGGNTSSGPASSSQGNSAIGAYALNSVTTGGFNAELGLGGLIVLTTGSSNTCFGYQCGSSLVSGIGNVFLGNQAGYFETGSNKLYIANAGGVPLIYGDFSLNKIGINTQTLNASLNIGGGTMQLQTAFTVSTLPACNGTLKGESAYVTDALTPTYNGALTGGGTGASANVPVFCNGTSWTSH